MSPSPARVHPIVDSTDWTASVLPPDNLVPFRPRASSVAYRAIAAAGLGGEYRRYLQAMADHVRYAESRDWRWKVERGEVFCYAKAKTVGGECGVTDRSVRRAVKVARERGILEVRKCSRTGSAYVWKMPAEAAVPAADRSGVLAVREPRTELENEGAARQARAICSCGHSWPARFGAVCFACSSRSRRSRRRPANLRQTEPVYAAVRPSEVLPVPMEPGGQLRIDFERIERSVDREREGAIATAAALGYDEHGRRLARG